MKYRLLAAAAALAMSAGYRALDNTVTPEMAEPGLAEPHVALPVGNSSSFYNCGVHGYLRGLNKNASPRDPLEDAHDDCNVRNAPLHPLEQ